MQTHVTARHKAASGRPGQSFNQSVTKLALAAGAVAAVLTTGLLARPAAAQFVWDGGGADNNWSTGDNWSSPVLDNTEPSSSTDAVLNNGDTILVSFPGEEARDFIIGSEEGGNGSGTLHVVDGGDLTLNLLDVGRVAGSSGTLLMEGGAITLNDFRLFRFGVAEGSTGTLTMTGGNITVDSALPQVDLFLIGDNGDATGTVSGGSITAYRFGIGFQGPSTASLDVSGNAVITATNTFEIGARGDGILNMTGGTITAGADILIGLDGATGATGVINQSGGSISTDAIISVARFGEATINQSGGSLSAGGANFFGQTTGLLVGDNGIGTYNLEGTGTFTSTEGAVILGAFFGNDTDIGTVNQSGTSTLTARGMVVGRDGVGIYNMNGGTLDLLGSVAEGDIPDEYDNLIIGRNGGGGAAGQGTFTQTAGTVNVAENVFLGDFDDSSGTYRISGGALNIAGDLSVAGALASNAAPDDVRTEPADENDAQGQALNAAGLFGVEGTGGSINIGGNLIANPANKSALRSGPGRSNTSILQFVFGVDGVSVMAVDGVADLDGAIIDLESAVAYLTANGSATLIEALGGLGNVGGGTTENVGTGEDFVLAAGDETIYQLSVEPITGGGERLVATLVPEPTAMAGLLGGLGLLLRRRTRRA